MNIEEVKRKIIEHDRKINYEEIEKLKIVKDRVKVLLNKLKDIEKYIDNLEFINIKEISGENSIKEDELEILYKIYHLYSELSNSFSEFYKELLEYYILLKKEII